MHQVTFYPTLKMPAVHLPGYHKIYLVRLYGKMGEVNGMRTGAFSEQHQVIKGMPVLAVQVLMLLYIRPQALHQQVLLSMTRNDAVNIIYRYLCLCHG